MGVEDHGDPRGHCGVVEQALLTLRGRGLPLAVGGPVDLEDLAEPLDRVAGAGVINEPEAAHQFVSSAKYSAARRRMSRSSRSRAFSRPSFRIRSASAIAAASDWSVLPARGFDEKRATQFYRVLRLIPSSAATEFSDAPSVDSYKATASRLNCSE